MVRGRVSHARGVISARGTSSRAPDTHEGWEIQPRSRAEECHGSPSASPGGLKRPIPRHGGRPRAANVGPVVSVGGGRARSASKQGLALREAVGRATQNYVLEQDGDDAGRICNR